MNFNTDYGQLLTNNTGGYMGGGVGTSQQTQVQNNGMGNGWLSDMFGALPGTINAVGNLVNGPAPAPNVYVNQTPGFGGGGNNMWLILGAVAIGAVILVVALK